MTAARTTADRVRSRRRRLRAIGIGCVLLAVAGLVSALVFSGGAAGDGPVLPTDNLITNASFESGTAGWRGTQLARVAVSGAPDGAFAARVATRDGRLSVDDWPGSVTASVAGTTYRGTLRLAAAAPSALGRTADLVVREHRPDGTEVASWHAATRLSTAFRTVAATGTAHADGDYVDVYVYEPGAAAGDAMYVDAVSLTARAPVPVTDEVADPSFELPLTPWRFPGGTAIRVRTADAPDGAYVARVRYTGSAPTLSIDGRPVARRSTGGERYQASMLVAAADPAAVGRTIRLAVREHPPGGRGSTAFRSAPLALTTSYQRIRVAGPARSDGDVLDVHLSDEHPVRGEAIDVDAASLAAEPSTLGELAIGVGQASALGDTGRYRYVIIQDYAYAHIAGIKRTDPRTKVLAYLNASNVHRRDCAAPDPPAYAPHDSFGVDYCYVQAHDPQWFLTDRDGNRLTSADFPNNLPVDIGQPGYRRLWAHDAIAVARADGFDGIYLDDVNTRPGHGLDGRIARYSDAEYGAAMVGFVRAVAGSLADHHLLAIANVGVEPWVGRQADDAAAIGASVTAVNKEFYSRWGSECDAFSAGFTDPASAGNPSLRTLEALQSRLEAAGGHLTAIDYGATPTSADRAAMTYGRASFLLTWNGMPGSAYIFRPCGAQDPADPSWTTELGLPTAPVRRVSGAWVRPYTDGLVVLNPSPTAPATVPLDGAFVTAQGAPVTGSVTLSPASAALLLSSG